MKCKNCGETIWHHPEMDFDGLKGNGCEKYEVDMTTKQPDDQAAAKLLPCPFCGYSASISEVESAGGNGRMIHIVGCNSEDCDVSFHGHARKVDAAKAWNTRQAAAYRRSEQPAAEVGWTPEPRVNAYCPDECDHPHPEIFAKPQPAEPLGDVCERPRKCPTCDSPDPKRHPAMQFEGEVQVCKDVWHHPELYAFALSLDEKLAPNPQAVEADRLTILNAVKDLLRMEQISSTQWRTLSEKIADWHLAQLAKNGNREATYKTASNSTGNTDAIAVFTNTDKEIITMPPYCEKCDSYHCMSKPCQPKNSEEAQMPNRRDEKWKAIYAKAELFAEDEDLYNDPIDAMTNFAVAQRRELLEGLRAKVEKMGYRTIHIGGGEVADFVDKADVLALLDGEGGCE